MKKQYHGVWRVPSEDTYSFPNLMVSDDTSTGSINIRNSRLPLWAIIDTAIGEGWDAVEKGWSPEKIYGFREEDLAYFLYCLLEQRGEFGRLVLLMADVERRANGAAWWERKGSRNGIIKQLQSCLAALEATAEVKESEGDALSPKGVA